MIVGKKRERERKMEPVVIETLGCSLDPDLLKSWEQFSLESSSSHTSDYSESSDEETQIKNDLIEQLKNLSFDDILDSKCLTSKGSNKISKISFQREENFGELIFVENKEIEENHSSSLKEQELLKFDVEADTEPMFCKCPNKNNEIICKKNNTEKSIFKKNFESVRNELSSLSVSDSNGDAAEYESDSNNDRPVESIILRERYPIRYNRPESNNLRTAPFSRNDAKTSKPHLNSNNSQLSENFASHIFHEFETSHNGYDSSINIINADFERYGIVSPSGRTFSSNIPSSEAVACEAVEGMVSSVVENQILNNTFQCTAGNQMVNFRVPCEETDQIFDGVNPHSLDAILDSVVPSTHDIINSNVTFSEEIDSLCFDNLKERIFLGCEITDVEEKTLNSSFEDLSEEETNILKNLANSTLNDIFSQNHEKLIEEPQIHVLSSKEVEKVLNNLSILNQNTSIASIINETNYPNNNHNFHPELGLRHLVSNPNVEETSLISNLYEESGFGENSSQFYTSEYLANEPSSDSNLSCDNMASIICDSLSPSTSDYRTVSNEIEHEIVKWKEIEEWVKKGQTNMPECSSESNWNALPFEEWDDYASLEYINLPENNESKDPKMKNNNQISKSPCKTEKTKICWMLGTTARNKLFNSSSFCKGNWEHQNEEIRQQIESGLLGTKEKKVIHVLKKNRKTKYRGTNLHYAILEGNTEKVFCLVECHKECHDGINEINLRDSFSKTVLDYSKEKGMDLLSDYLEENTARVSINIK